jgi:hypothetical protein
MLKVLSGHFFSTSPNRKPIPPAAGPQAMIGLSAGKGILKAAGIPFKS